MSMEELMKMTFLFLNVMHFITDLNINRLEGYI